MNTLFEYYKSKGQNLPGIKDRAKTYESLGLGTGYQGTTDQNISLLNRLQTMASKPATPAVPMAPAAPIAAPAPATPAPANPAPASPAPAAAPTDSYASLFDSLKKSLGLDTLIEKVKSGFSSAPKKADIYAREIANAGVDQKTADLNDLNARIASVNSSLSASDQDIRDRINRSGGIVTDSQVQRLVAAEKAPLIDQYQGLVGTRSALEGGVRTAEERAKQMAEMKYSDATAPQNAATEELKLLTSLADKAYSPAEKDLTERLKTAADTTKATSDMQNDLAMKGYSYVSTPAERDRLKAQGYDIMQINGRTYAKPGTLTDYEAKKKIDAKYKAPSTKAPANKNYTAANIPANVKGDLLADIQAGNKKEDVYKVYPEVSTTYIDSLYSKRKS